MHTTLSKADAARRKQQNAEGLFGALFAATRGNAASLRKAAGVTTPDPASAPNRMLSPGEAAAEAERRLNRPETTHEREMRLSAQRQADLLASIKAMHNGAQSTPSTGPKSL